MFGIAAAILFALAAIFQFAGFHKVSPLGLAFVGLACLALHLLPWKRSP